VKVVAEKEKEPDEAVRMAVELAEKEALDKYVEK
jgi:hypothetical protein